MTISPVLVDETLSFAHRAGNDVRVTLRLSAAELSSGSAEVRCAARRRTVVLPAVVVTDDHGGATVTFSSTLPELRAPVAWSLAVRQGPAAEFVPVQARLLTRPAQPTALLPGPVPETRMPAPAPRPVAGTEPVVRRLVRQLPAPVQETLRRGRTIVRGALRR